MGSVAFDNKMFINLRTFFSLRSLVLFATAHVVVLWYLYSHFDFSQARAIDRLSKMGWTFSHCPKSELSFVPYVLSTFVPEHYTRTILFAKSPKGYNFGTLRDAETALVQLKDVNAYILIGGNLTREDFETIGKISNCTELDLRFCHYHSDVTNIGETISKLRRLEIVRFSSWKVDGSFLRTLDKLSHMREMELCGLVVTPDDIKHLLDFPSLRRLDLRLTKLSADEFFSEKEIIESVGDRTQVEIINSVQEWSRISEELKVGNGRLARIKRTNLPSVIVEY